MEKQGSPWESGLGAAVVIRKKVLWGRQISRKDSRSRGVLFSAHAEIPSTSIWNSNSMCNVNPRKACGEGRRNEKEEEEAMGQSSIGLTPVGDRQETQTHGPLGRRESSLQSWQLSREQLLTP